MASDRAVGPLFVVGMWRSGTSLLYALLNQHPQIALMYEAELPVLWPLFWMPGRSRWAARWDLWNSALARHRIDLKPTPRDPCRLREACERVYKDYAARKGACIWGEKSPNYYDCLTRIARQFPNAKFILIWRSPLNVCGSVVRAAAQSSWFAKRGMVSRALLGCKRMKVQCEWLIDRGIPVHQVNYEELISDTAEVMTGVCEFLNIPFDVRMTSLNAADRSAVYEGAHHTLVKSEHLVAGGSQLELLSSELRGKIERYLSLWREQHHGEWPKFPKPAAAGNTPKPSLAERGFDEVRYRLLRSFDLAVRLAYCASPLWVWKAYRGVKRQVSLQLTGNKKARLAP